MVLPQGFWKYTVDQLRAGCEKHGIDTTECKHCSSTVTVSKCATSDLITHLKRHHSTTAKQSSVTSFVSCTPQKWKSTDYRQQATTDLLVQFIAESLHPLSVVEGPAFHAFVENLNPRYSVPSRKYLRSTPLPAKTADKTATIKSLFSSVKCVSLTLDLWSSNDMWSFMGITCHCINGYQLHSILLACSRFQRKSSADHILE